MTSDSSRVFVYDDENRLIEVTVASATRSTFGYDGLGRLRSLSSYSWNGSSWVLNGTTRYIYDGRLVIQERNTSDTPLVAYTRGTDLSGMFQAAGGIGGMLARSSTYQSGNFTNHHAYHADYGGNITALVGTNQAVSATYRYEPFGKLIASSGTMAGQNTYRFSSKQFVGGPDIYDFGFRFYEPSYQRWMNQDPIQESGGINLFTFCLNDPLSGIDPFGLKIVNNGADAKIWDHLLDCWRKKLPVGSPLRKLVEDLDNTDKELQIKPMRDAKLADSSKLTKPLTQLDGGKSKMFIDPRSFTVGGRKTSTAETFAHELLHAHDQLVNTRNQGRGKFHDEGFMDDEKELFNEIPKAKCR